MFLKDKWTAEGVFEKFKARLVATPSVMTIATIAAKEGRHAIVVDIGGAFLNASLADTGVIVHMRLDKTMTAVLLHIMQHYAEYLETHPVNFKGMPYSAVGSFIQNWWFNLHNEINVLNDKPIFDFADLQSTYAGVSVLFELATITNYITKATAASQVKISDYKAWKTEILMLNSRYY